MELRPVVIVDAVRTANTRGGRGAFVHKRPDDLLIEILKALAERNENVDFREVEDCAVGAVNQIAALSGNVGHSVVHMAGLPYEIAGQTSNRFCGSSMETTHRITQAIMTGTGDIGIAGGVERMGRGLAPPEADRGSMAKMFNSKMMQQTKDQMAMFPNHDEIFSVPFPDYILKAAPMQGMPQTAQNVAEVYGLTREEMDKFAYRSHMNAAEATEKGYFKSQIIPIEAHAPIFDDDRKLTDKKGDLVTVDKDECIRPDTTLERLAGLGPIKGVQSFAKPAEPINITAGNACPTNDAACAILLMSEEKAEKMGLEPLARIKSMAVAGVHPQLMGLGPIPSGKKAIERAGVKPEDIGLVELNEAFSSQSIACVKDLGVDPDIVNVNGGAIALGHPLGQSGSRLITTLAHEMRRRGDVQYGLATMCIGNGQGIATVLEKI